MKQHQIIVEAVLNADGVVYSDGEYQADLAIRCTCGEVLLDRPGEPCGGASIALRDVTEIISEHYVRAMANLCRDWIQKRG